MTRALDALALALLAASVGSFVAGLGAVGARDDVRAAYLFAIGAALLRAATELVRPERAA